MTVKKSSNKTTTVNLEAKDLVTEIAIFDNQFNRIASGFGSLSKDLEPGIYKVRWKTSSAFEDELIEITGSEKGDKLKIKGKTPPINSSAPLNNTKFGCIDKPDALKKMSKSRPALNPKKSTQLLVFLRDGKAGSIRSQAQSVSVHSSDGTRLVKLNEGFINTKEGYAGLTMGLDPGVYRLRVETGQLGSYEIFVFTADKWQTRVFLVCDDFFFGTDTFRRPMLRTTSILMGKIGCQFNPASRNARLAELALNALLRGYDILESRDLDGLLQSKFDDPMLGIYGAHLLLGKKPFKQKLFNKVCHRLYGLVGPIPDLQALYVKSEENMPESKDEKLIPYIGLPPMLIRSWDLLVRQSRKHLSIVPPGSLSDRIAGSIVSSEPWLMCRVDPHVEASQQPVRHVSIALGKRIFNQIVEQVGQTDVEKIGIYLKGKKENLNPIESAILSAAAMGDDSEGSDKLPKKATVTGFDFYPSKLSGDIEVKNIARNALFNLKVPSYSIARSAVSLASKLKGKFDFDIS